MEVAENMPRYLVSDLGFRVPRVGFSIQGVGFRVQGLGLGFRV